MPTKVGLGWKSLPGSNTLAYYENPLITAVISFIEQATGFKSFQLNPSRKYEEKVDKRICILK